MELKMDVFNGTEFELELKEERPHVEQPKARIKPNEKYCMRRDTSDTYSEYLVLHNPTGTIKVTPDDMAEYMSVTVKCRIPEKDSTAQPQLYWEGVRRDAKHTTSSSNIFARVLKFISRQNRHPDPRTGLSALAMLEQYFSSVSDIDSCPCRFFILYLYLYFCFHALISWLIFHMQRVPRWVMVNPSVLPLIQCRQEVRVWSRDLCQAQDHEVLGLLRPSTVVPKEE